MKVVKTVAMMIIFCVSIAGMASADDPSFYYSLHDPSQSYYYCSKDSGLGGALQFPCYSPYPYYNQVYYTGVKDRLNPDDMKVVCHLNPADATTCSSMTQTTFDFGGSVTPSSITSNFRLFIPPGAVNVTVQYYVPRDSQMVVLSRFGQPPVGSTETYPVTSIKAAPFTVSDYRTAEHPVMNTDGLITPISNDTPNNDFLQSLITTSGNTGGGWLYMKLLYYSGGNVQLVKFTLTVKLDIFRAWYTKVNAMSGYWDSMGNPPYISSENSLCTNPPTASITPNPSVTGGIQAGTTVNFSANSASGWTWNVTDASSGANVDLSGIPINNQNFSYTFNTSGKSYNVSLVVKDANGCSSSPTTVTVNVGSQSGSTQYTVNFVAGIGGSVSGNTSQLITQGGSATAVTPAPNTGYQFVNWTGSGGFASTANPLLISNITADMAVVANFQLIPVTTRTVTFVANTGGVITGNPEQRVTLYGETTAVKAIPNSGYQFVNWTGTGGFTTSTINPLTLQSVTYDMTITANYQKVPTSSQKLEISVDVPQDRIGRFADPRMITANEAKNYSSVVIEPILQFHKLPPGKYDLYAGILINGVLYLAAKDMLSQTVFVKWMGEDEVRSYDTKEFSGDQTHLFDVFENIKMEPLPSPQVFASIGARFFVLIAPSGSSNLNSFINSFRGAEIYFSPDIK